MGGPEYLQGMDKDFGPALDFFFREENVYMHIARKDDEMVLGKSFRISEVTFARQNFVNFFPFLSFFGFSQPWICNVMHSEQSQEVALISVRSNMSEQLETSLNKTEHVYKCWFCD